MLELVIERFATYRSALHGRLWVDGQHVCDTLEYEPEALPPGSYTVSQRHVESEGRKMMLISAGPYLFPWEKAELSSMPKSQPKSQPMSQPMSRPMSQPMSRPISMSMFRASNGPFALRGGCVSVGECHHLGYILRCAEVLDTLFLRVRMSISRGTEVRLLIRGEPKRYGE